MRLLRFQNSQEQINIQSESLFLVKTKGLICDDYNGTVPLKQHVVPLQLEDQSWESYTICSIHVVLYLHYH